MESGAQAFGRAFLRGERRLSVPEYIGLVASCQAAFDAAMAELPPSRQVDLWNVFHPETFLSSSGKRLLWVLRRGVLDDLAPKAESVLTQPWRPAPMENEQLVFRAMLEALATGRERPSELIEFCNEIYPWPSVQGVAEYLTGNLAAAVRVVTSDVARDRQARRLHLPSWALVGTLLDALDASPGRWTNPPMAFTAALAAVLGSGRGVLTSEHSRLLVELHFATDAGRRGFAPEPVLRAALGFTEESTASPNKLDDGFYELLRPLQGLQLIQTGREMQIGWAALDLVHLSPGQTAGELTFRPLY
jgi:hypothetical protein